MKIAAFIAIIAAPGAALAGGYAEPVLPPEDIYDCRVPVISQRTGEVLYFYTARECLQRPEPDDKERPPRDVPDREPPPKPEQPPKNDKHPKKEI